MYGYLDFKESYRKSQEKDKIVTQKYSSQTWNKISRIMGLQCGEVKKVDKYYLTNEGFGQITKTMQENMKAHTTCVDNH